MPFSVGKGCVFCCSLLVCGAFISAADTFITATDLRKLRRFGALFSTFLFACFHSGEKPPQWCESFACKSGCIGGKVRYSCAVRCVDLRTDSTPASLSWIVLVWLSPPILFEQRSVSRRFSPKKNKKATDKVALISERYLAGGLSCLLKASLV